MIEIVFGMFAIALIFFLVVTSKIIDNAYKRGHDEGWEDCYMAHNQYEMSEDDKLVLEAMKKALKEYIRKKKYVKEEDRKMLNNIEDFNEFRHLVFLTCVYRKEMAQRNEKVE